VVKTGKNPKIWGCFYPVWVFVG